MIWLTLYVLGIFGFGGLFFALGRDDYSWPVLVLMALGWFPLLVGFAFLLVLAARGGDF